MSQYDPSGKKLLLLAGPSNTEIRGFHKNFTVFLKKFPGFSCNLGKSCYNSNMCYVQYIGGF